MVEVSYRPRPPITEAWLREINRRLDGELRFRGRRVMVPRAIEPYLSWIDGSWTLLYLAAATGHVDAVNFEGELSEDDAVAAAEHHIAKHGQLHVEVEVHLDD